jgi:molybdate transport system ATP-binding protein
MVDGRIQQSGPVREVFSFPANHAVAQSVGTETVVPGEVAEVREGLLIVQAGRVQITSVDPGDLGGREVYLCIRAEDVILERGPTSRDSARNHLPGRITSIIPEGVLMKVMLDCGIPLSALVTKPSCEELNLKEGDPVTAVIKATAIHLVPRTPAPVNRS